MGGGYGGGARLEIRWQFLTLLLGFAGIEGPGEANQ